MSNIELGEYHQPYTEEDDYSLEDMTNELQASRWFKITFYAEKHNTIITRFGRFLNDKCKIWITKKGKVAVCYEQLDSDYNSMGFRTATNIVNIMGKSKVLPDEVLN